MRYNLPALNCNSQTNYTPTADSFIEPAAVIFGFLGAFLSETAPGTYTRLQVDMLLQTHRACKAFWNVVRAIFALFLSRAGKTGLRQSSPAIKFRAGTAKVFEEPAPAAQNAALEILSFKCCKSVRFIAKSAAFFVRADRPRTGAAPKARAASARKIARKAPRKKNLDGSDASAGRVVPRRGGA